MADQRVRQAICAMCSGTVRPGKGVVQSFGEGGRIHKECHPNAQKVNLAGLSKQDGPQLPQQP